MMLILFGNSTDSRRNLFFSSATIITFVFSYNKIESHNDWWVGKGKYTTWWIIIQIMYTPNRTSFCIIIFIFLLATNIKSGIHTQNVPFVIAYSLHLIFIYNKKTKLRQFGSSSHVWQWNYPDLKWLCNFLPFRHQFQCIFPCLFKWIKFNFKMFTDYTPFYERIEYENFYILNIDPIKRYNPFV